MDARERWRGPGGLRGVVEADDAQVIGHPLRGAFTADHAPVVSGVLAVALPLLVVFAVLGKQLVAGVMAGAVKG